jgi:hypothetical protein
MQRPDAVLQLQLALLERERLLVFGGRQVHAIQKLAELALELPMLVFEVPQLIVGRFSHSSPSCHLPLLAAQGWLDVARVLSRHGFDAM